MLSMTIKDDGKTIYNAEGAEIMDGIKLGTFCSASKFCGYYVDSGTALCRTSRSDYFCPTFILVFTLCEQFKCINFLRLRLYFL